MRTRAFWIRVAIFTALLAIPFSSIALVLYAAYRVRTARRADARLATLRLRPAAVPARVALRTDGRTVIV